MQRFYKGRTNNHLTWGMVDATDFATPESAVSAATTIKIYGKLQGATGVNFVTSGTGSLTNDIQHVGPSVTGAYTIALASADLSDASAAFYDHYIIALSAPGCARQLLVVEGDFMESRQLLAQSRISDLQSYLVAMSGMLSDAHSAAILAASNASEAQSHATLAASRVLLVQSRLSDFNSVYVSDISDIRSMLTALSDAISDAHSDLASKIGGVTATVSASDMSDIASRVDVVLASRLSDILSAAQQANSRVLVVQSSASDIYSMLSDAISGAITASDLSDIASAVWAHTVGARVDSRVLLNQSRISDLQSYAVAMSGMLSDTHSGATAAASRALINQSRISDVQSYLVALSDQLSDAHSDLKSAIANVSVTLTASDISDIASAVAAAAGTLSASEISDIASAVWANTIGARVDSRVLLNLSRISDAQSAILVTQSMASDAASAAQQANSRLLVNQSVVSDIYSLLSDVHSDVGVLSGVVSDVRSGVSDMHSDLVSKLGALDTSLDQSDLSDIASAVWARLGADPTGVPAVTGTMGAKLDWIAALARNEIVQNNSSQVLKNDAGTIVARAPISENAGTSTFTRSEWTA